MRCFRCGRNGHTIHSCFARSTVDGRSLPHPTHGHGTKPTKNKTASRSGVYVLRYPNGMFYVGKSSDIDKRIREHASGNVSCTAKWGIPEEVPAVTPSIATDHESWERNETLEQMQRNGIEKVRGWMYTSQEITEDAEENIMAQLCEKYDSCRYCGSTGHFISACPKYHKAKPSHRGIGNDDDSLSSSNADGSSSDEDSDSSSNSFDGHSD